MARLNPRRLPTLPLFIAHHGALTPPVQLVSGGRPRRGVFFAARKPAPVGDFFAARRLTPVGDLFTIRRSAPVGDFFAARRLTPVGDLT